ncbi:MAG: Na(+)-translocating NADH-quinone reductase subunit A [Bacteroidales bacterium]|nr:Na(+)-translocating NADH-quinone reductase subunit A [Bacteroidales bacterium]
MKKGLDIPISGAAALTVKKTVRPDVVAIKPTDFKGFIPRLLVREGDKVLAGSPVLADKKNPDILFTSPVSGTIEQVVRGEKRKLLAVLVKADGTQESVDFGKKDPKNLSAEDVKAALLQSGLWPAIIQRPYGVVASPTACPKAIFISAFNTAPLAADTEFVLAEELSAIQAGVDALAKVAKVHVCVKAGSAFAKLQGVEIHTVSGKHPAGNVGVQISHISPIMKDQTVWTVSLLLTAAIGKLFTTGKYDVTRKVAVTGPEAIEPSYVQALPGIPVKALSEYYNNANADVRFVSGDCLSGENVGEDGYLGFFDNQVTLLHEETERELFGWINPIRSKQFSSSRSYFSWLCPKKKYNMGTNFHGGPRPFLMSDVYGAVLPMEIFPVYLAKACLAQDIEKMEKFGIYEVLPEDLALCEFVDPSKNDIQAMIAAGIDLMIKEMA